MKRESVALPHTELQLNLPKRFWDTWEIPLTRMTLRIDATDIRVYGWKSDVQSNVCETVDGTPAEVRL
jgi:hypothetical protein